MRKFVWRLARVFEIKKKEEQKKQSELLITEKLAQVHSELLIRKKILENVIYRVAKESPAKRLGRQELLLKSSVTNDKLIKSLEKIMSDLKTQQKEKKTELLKLKRFNKSLEKLRTEAETQFIKEQNRLEQKQADETSTIRFARKIISNGTAVNC